MTLKATRARLVEAAEELRDALRPLLSEPAPQPAAHLLCPLDYAFDNYCSYITRHARAPIEALMVGMNPGPWGMGQTGVPFGDPGLVRSFLGIRGAVDRPAQEHPRCPVLGLASPRAEVSGQRLWGSIESCFEKPRHFFERFFVANYCPLLFLNERGANVTPDKLPKQWMEPVLFACDAHITRLTEILEPRQVLGIGVWSTKRLKLALTDHMPAEAFGTVLHPSPASPAANRGWLPAALQQLAALGVPWPEPGTS